jgi:hypothetical protein
VWVAFPSAAKAAPFPFFTARLKPRPFKDKSTLYGAAEAAPFQDKSTLYGALKPRPFKTNPGAHGVSLHSSIMRTKS